MTFPTWMFRLDSGVMKQQLFSYPPIPEGWYDSPGEAREAAEKAATKGGGQAPEGEPASGINDEPDIEPETDGLDLSTMTKAEMEVFARERFGIELDRRWSETRLRDRLSRLMAG